MLNREENELLTRTGPGTPMGALLRQYWIPVVLSSEVAAGGRVKRVKLLGERLIAFRAKNGRPVRGQVGELVVTAPWPGMTQGFWKDPQRYEETYWSRWPDVWVHGDWAYVDADGFWFIQGRSDDTLKIAGKRLGPAEVESVLVSHEAVAEAGVVGVPHEVKGEAIVCFVVLRPLQRPSEALRGELSDLVARQMGKALKPERVLFTRDLPKTRSAKIMRRVIRAAYLGREPGDLSSLENPAAVTAVKEAV